MASSPASRRDLSDSLPMISIEVLLKRLAMQLGMPSTGPVEWNCKASALDSADKQSNGCMGAIGARRTEEGSVKGGLREKRFA
mmetsp:Transcript_48132/g.111463  ORF Transcript_48132/g.111463 Transcript_48132/m.111463 type:complete len:83 (+) Transcript_48132:861-1109(+)